MKKSIIKIIIAVFLVIVSGVCFLYNLNFPSVLTLAAFTALIFFYNSNVISVGMVKLWCINIGLSMFFIYEDALRLNNNTCFVLVGLWGLINLYGIYNTKKLKTKNEA